ncbi:MAG: VanZ family protein [Patescibacteria group bacterium]|jgi:glycopeptide antibiotics resistance protein
MKAKPNILAVILFIAYLAMLMKLLVFKYPPAMTFDIANGNFVPFKTILNYLSGEPTWRIAIRNIVGNIILFIPVGFLVSFFRRPPTWKFVLIAAFVVSAMLEIIQGIFRAGVVDVDDVLLNVFGAVIGYGGFVCIELVKTSLKNNFGHYEK